MDFIEVLEYLVKNIALFKLFDLVGIEMLNRANALVHILKNFLFPKKRAGLVLDQLVQKLLILVHLGTETPILHLRTPQGAGLLP